MKKITIYTTMLLAGLYTVTGALAENAAPAPAPTAMPSPVPLPPEKPAAAPQRFYLEVDPDDLRLISQAINELPKRLADPLVLKLNAQLQASSQAEIARNKEADEKPKRRK